MCSVNERCSTVVRREYVGMYQDLVAVECAPDDPRQSSARGTHVDNGVALCLPSRTCGPPCPGPVVRVRAAAAADRRSLLFSRRERSVGSMGRRTSSTTRRSLLLSLSVSDCRGGTTRGRNSTDLVPKQYFFTVRLFGTTVSRRNKVAFGRGEGWQRLRKSINHRARDEGRKVWSIFRAASGGGIKKSNRFRRYVRRVRVVGEKKRIN
jgi:hypothetical protein